jgi:hypothetical protein
MIRTRRGVAIGAVVVFAATGAVVAGGYHFGLASVWGARAASVTSLTDYAPADSDVVMYADLAALRTSPLLQPLESVASNTQQDADYTAFVRATGFDYSTDLDRLMLVSRKNVAGGPSELIAVGEGRFDKEKIRSYALANGTVERRGSKEVFLVKSDRPGKTIALTFLGANRIAISDSGSLDAILSPPATNNLGEEGAPATGAADSSAGQALATRVARVAGVPLFIVWRTRNLPQNFAPGGIQSQQLSDLIRSMHWGDLTVQPMNDRLRLTLEGECETPDQAATLDGALTTLRLFAEGMLGSEGIKKNLDPQLLAFWHQLLDSTAISHNDRWASLSLDVSQDFLQYAAQHMKQAPPAAPAVHPIPSGTAPPAPAGAAAPSPATPPPPPPAPAPAPQK